MRIETLVALGVSALCASVPVRAAAAPPPTCGPASATNVDPRRELRIDGRVKELSLSPTGRIWLSTATGHTYLADQIDGDWKQGALLLTSPDSWLGMSIDRISFFDANTAVATGYLRATPGGGPTDTLYRTTDAGVTWQPVSFGSSEWIYDVFTSEAGEAWMGGSEGSFLHSSDAGKTWEARTAPFDGSSRTHSIFMTSSTTGYVGALHDAIRTTTDGGNTWRDLPTPFGQGRIPKLEKDQRDHRIEKIAVAAGLLLVEQDGRVFRSSPDRVEWAPFEPELISFAVDRSTDRMVGITTDLHVVEFDAAQKATPLASEPLRARPIDIESVNGTVTVLDVNNGLSQLDKGGLEFAYPLTSGGPATPLDRVRKRGELLWGATLHHVYNSRDGGQSWCRVGQMAFDIDGFVVKDDDRILLWDGHGTNMIFDRRSGQAQALTGLRGDDVIDVVTLPDLWVAYGGRQFETAQRIDVARTYFAGQFRGSRENGFVYVSRDDGDTWDRIDEWREGGVARVFVAPNGGLWLLSYLGSIRRLDRSERTYRATNLIVANEKNRDRVPYVERATAFYFADDRIGYITGWTHYLGNKSFKTTDGGTTWMPIEESRFPYGLLAYGRGACVASDGRRVVVLRAGAAEPLTAVSRLFPEAKAYVSDLSVDESGGILVQVSSGEPGDENGEQRWFSVPMPTSIGGRPR